MIFLLALCAVIIGIPLLFLLRQMWLNCTLPIAKDYQLITTDSPFEIGQTVWAVQMNDTWDNKGGYQFRYSVIGPTQIIRMDGSITEKGHLDIDSYGLKDHFRHDGFCSEMIFTNQEEAVKYAYKRNECIRCRDDHSPNEEVCEHCPLNV